MSEELKVISLLQWQQADVCTCGHSRIAHNDIISMGHGSCIRCACRQFTWAYNNIQRECRQLGIKLKVEE